MKLKLSILGTVACLALVAGCAALPTVADGNAPDPGVTATATLDIQDTAGRHILSVTPWVKANIDHVKCAIYRDGVATPATTLTVVQADLTKTVTFTNLIRSQLYHVELQAWSDNLETSEIDNLSNNAASCTTDFTTGTNLAVVVGVLDLHLVDKVFVGTSTGSLINVTDGTVRDTTDTEAASIQ